MSVDFSSNETVSLEKQIDTSIKVIKTASEDIDYFYEIDKCTNWIRNHNLKKVCLQFPDSLLGDSSEVAQRLQSNLEQTVYVLGDTAYESCCLDYVAAAHVNADAIIHYGPVCSSKPSGEIPSLFIYEKNILEICRLETELQKYLQELDNVIMLLDTSYMSYFDLIHERFQNYSNLRIASIINNKETLELATVIFIGGHMRKLLNLKLSFNPNILYYYDPMAQTPKLINYDQDGKVLKRRNFLREKIKDSQTIGIVIGTLAVKNYLKVIDRTKKIITASGRKYYVISVGKPTVAKLANFLELDLYVVISCAMNEIYESRDYYKPIVAPIDIELALNPITNAPRPSYDYNTYVQDSLTLEDITNIKKSSDGDVSLITGKVRSVEKDENKNDSNEIILKTGGALAVNSGVGFLSTRSWQGLEQKLGETTLELASEGRKGIAQGYVNEKS